jgi:hypothetical protein
MLSLQNKNCSRVEHGGQKISFKGEKKFLHRFWKRLGQSEGLFQGALEGIHQFLDFVRLGDRPFESVFPEV